MQRRVWDLLSERWRARCSIIDWLDWFDVDGYVARGGIRTMLVERAQGVALCVHLGLRLRAQSYLPSCLREVSVKCMLKVCCISRLCWDDSRPREHAELEH